jgi:RNA polymerase sigma-70 factor (ECF subfamily)
VQLTEMAGEISLPNSNPQSDVTEWQLIRRAQDGDASAFEYLYRSHSRRVYAVCLRMVGNTAIAEELTQDAFMQMFRKIGTFRGDSSLSTWLHRLTFNVVLMHLRKKTSPQISLNDGNAPEEERHQPFEIPFTDPALKSSLDRLNLTRAIAELAPGYREKFFLHDVMGYEHNEIAKMLQCSIGNSKSQLHKARKHLREILQGKVGRELTKRVRKPRQLARSDREALATICG